MLDGDANVKMSDRVKAAKDAIENPKTPAPKAPAAAPGTSKVDALKKKFGG